MTGQESLNHQPKRTRIMNQLDQILSTIARNHLFIETLKTRRSDSLDFHNVAVWAVRDALAAAYEGGHEKSTRDLVQSANTKASMATPEVLAPLDLAVLYIDMARNWLLPLRLPVAKECACLTSALDGLRALQRDVHKAHDRRCATVFEKQS
jgi:hypothetical protein